MITPQLCKEAQRQFRIAFRHRTGNVCMFPLETGLKAFPPYVMDRYGFGLGFCKQESL